MKGILGVGIAAVVLGIGLPALAGPPGLLRYQGFLTDKEGTPVEGEWSVTFRFFGTQQGAVPFFEETQTVEPELGVFSALLGTEPGNSIDLKQFEDGDVWLGLVVNGTEGPVELSPRQRVTSGAYAFFAGTAAVCDVAENALSLGGVGAGSYVTLSQLPELCVAPEDLAGLVDDLAVTEAELPDLLIALGVGASNLTLEDVQAWLEQNGYGPGPYFSGKYEDLTGAPDLSGFAKTADLAPYALVADLADLVTGPECVQLNKDSGLYLLADGSVALAGDLDAAGHAIENMAVMVCPDLATVENPPQGLLCFMPDTGSLVVWDGEFWVVIGASATDVACSGCIDAGNVAFSFAASDKKGGSALSALDVSCAGCIDAGNVSFPWAKADLPGGQALSALQSDLALDVSCAGCVSKAELGTGVLASGNVSYDDAATKLTASTVQEAIEKLNAKVGSGGSGEGFGSTFMQVREWSLAPYGKGRTYQHFFNPAAAAKVLAFLYADEAGSSVGGTKIVSAPFSPNAYSAVMGTKGTSNLVATTAYVFNVGSHILLHQTTGANPGTWELSQVSGVEGSTLILSKPLQNEYGPGAQAVVAASYGQLIVEAGGELKPIPYSASTGTGGILYIRAENIMVKSGGKVTGDAAGFPGGTESSGLTGMAGSSECKAPGGYTTAKNCSGGGGASGTGGGGGGGNKTAGQAAAGEGGGTKGDANLLTLQMGGGGGSGLGTRKGGAGGGIVVLGASTVLVENGGVVSAAGAAPPAAAGGMCANQWEYKGFQLCGVQVGNINADAVPSGCSPLQPSTGWGQSDFVAVCQHFMSAFGGSPAACNSVDMDADGGLCTNFQAIAGWEYNSNPDVWLRSPTFSWQPTNGGQTCAITNDSSNILVYSCAGYAGGGGAGGTVAVFADQYVSSGTLDVGGGVSEAGDGGTGWFGKQAPIPGAINAMFPKGVQIWIDGVDVTAVVGDPNSKGSPDWDDAKKLWGATGTKAWTSGMLDLSSVANWTLGEHSIELVETGGAGGNLKLFLYTIYPFSASSAPANDTCAGAVTLNVTKAGKYSGTTEDVMGKLKAVNDYNQAGCGGASGADVVYTFTLADYGQVKFDVVSAFAPRMYIRSGNCATGPLVACGDKTLATDILKAGTYYLFVDADLQKSRGDFNLVVTPVVPGPPSNDTCAGAKAVPLVGGSGEVTGLSLFALNDYSAACGGADAPEVVFSVDIPPQTSQATFTVVADYAPVFYIHKGVCGGNLISCVPGKSYTMQWPSAGTYFVFVDGKTAADSGEYTLQVTLQ